MKEVVQVLDLTYHHSLAFESNAGVFPDKRIQRIADGSGMHPKLLTEVALGRQEGAGRIDTRENALS